MLTAAIISLIPVPLFYAIYFRHFFTYYRGQGRTPEYLKHFEALLAGIALALVIVLIAPWIEELIPQQGILIQAFIKAALVEKLGALVTICLVQRYYRSFSILEGIISSVLVGIGFSMVENIAYALNYGFSIIIVRVIFSVPVHIITCGIMGYFVSLARISGTRFYGAAQFIPGIIIPYLIHGTFDLLLIADSGFSYMVAPLIIVVTAMLEILVARSKIIPAKKSLEESGLRLEDWLLKYRQPRYERWIQNSMGAPKNIQIPFLVFRPGIFPWAVSLCLGLAAWLLFPLRGAVMSAMGLHLSNEEATLIVSAFPASLALISIMVGSVNPRFFKQGVVRLPIIFDAVLCRPGEEESLVSFDISSSGFFLRTFEPLDPGEGTTIYFENAFMKSPPVSLRTVWENHSAACADEPTGSIAAIEKAGAGFYRFLARYYLFRIRKGIVFNLKLPGFEQIRRLFLRPTTVMQKEVLYQPGTTVFRQGDRVNAFYYIRKGKVNIYKELQSGERVLLETIEAGHIFNEMALLGDTKRNVTAECETLCVLALAEGDNLGALIKNNPDFALALVQKLAHRVDETQNALTQTIEYIQNLTLMRTRRAHNASLLLTLLKGLPIENGEIIMEIDPSVTGTTIPFEHGQVMSYIAAALELPIEEKTELDPAAAAAIDAFLNRISLTIREK